MSAIMASVFLAGSLQPVHTTAPPHNDHDESDQVNEVKSRENWPPHLLFGYCFQHEADITSAAMNRRNSEPTITPPEALTTATMERRQSLSTGDIQSASEEFLRTLRPEPEPEPEPEPVPETSTCTVCYEEIPHEKSEPESGQKVIRPCAGCSTPYCSSCIKNMFLGATKDLSRMPPRCCKQIHLHHARPQMTDVEITEYKSKYEEWSTMRPFYCPVPTCSVFIPNRLLPQVQQQSNADGEKRVDSGTGTPTDKFFACPACEGQICLDCRQTAHPNAMCANLDRGLDLQTARVLRRWGYGRCPKCSHGVKRMYGCNRMECRCGAHFCWTCKLSWDECGNNCDDDDGISDEDDLISEAGGETDNEDQVNLDNRDEREWREMDLGREPANDISDQSWDCRHSFYSLGVLIHPLGPRFAQDMECVKCWRMIHPGPARDTNFVPPWDEEKLDADVTIGQECDNCALLVCVPCKNIIVAAQEEKQRRKEAEENARNNENEQDESESGDDGDEEEELTATANDNNNDETTTQNETNEATDNDSNEATTQNETTIQTNNLETQTDPEARPA